MNEFGEFKTNVLKQLDYINYKDMLTGLDFDPADLTMCIFKTIVTSYIGGLSPMMTACAIYGFTWEYQVVPSTKKMVRH